MASIENTEQQIKYKFKILVLGYYNRSNLGDEMFKQSIPYFFPKSKLDFVCTDDYDFNINVQNYDAIICGGGDIINDYFYKKLIKITNGFKKNIFAFGVGIPYKGLISSGYLDIFDHVFIRNRTDIRLLQHRLGSDRVHYLPDLGFKLLPPVSNSNIKIEKNPNYKGRIGVFLIQSVYKYKSIVYSLTKIIDWLASEYEITFYLFNTSQNCNEDDSYISNDIASMLSVEHKNIKVDITVYTVNQMFEIMQSLDYGICMRFHSHIFATIAELPFLSIYSTRKVEQYIKEEEYIWACPIELSEDSKPFRLNAEYTIEKFKELVRDYDQVKAKLKYIRDNYYSLLDTLQPYHLIKNIDKRPIQLDIIESVDVLEVYRDIRAMLVDKAKYDPYTREPPQKPINNKAAEEVGKHLCMMITGMPSSKYVFGTINNLKSRPENLLEMIKYIKDDYNKDYLIGERRLNFNYIKQEEFKGLHRAGWQFVIEHMYMLNTFNGVLVDVYLDRTFHWGKYIMESKGIIPYTSPWIGFFHHTPDEDYTEYNTTILVQEPLFIKSLIICQGLITLSQYLADWFKVKLEELGYGHIPVISLYHPTIFPSKKFNMDNFLANQKKRLVNVGAWYRNPFTIHVLEVSKYFTKTSLKHKDMNNYFKPTPLTLTHKDFTKETHTHKWIHYLMEYIKTNNYLLDNFKLNSTDIPEEFELNLDDDYVPDNIWLRKLKNYLKDKIQSVEILESLPNDEYDKLFSENVIFLNLINCSAANTIIESIVRNTPVIINYLDPAAEYFGPEYPLFYKDISEINSLLTIDNIQAAHIYLTKMDKEFLRIETFMESFKSSHLYKNLNVSLT